jgi:hypothetical protein
MKRRGLLFVVAVLTLSVLQFSNAEAAQVTSNLLIDLNAANSNSYSGTGTTWIDLAGTADNGTLTNGPVFTASPAAGFILDGNDDYIQIPNTTAVQPTTTKAFTVMAWAKIDTYTAGDGIFGKQYADAQIWDGYSLIIDNSNAIGLAMNGQSVSATYLSTSNVFTLGTWTLFTAVVQFGGSSARPSKAYVNGTEVASGNNTDGSVPNNTAPFRIGEAIQGYGQRPGMTVGAFAVYDRALTAQEITDSYNYYLNYVYVPESSSISLSSITTANKGVSITVTAAVGTAGKVRFFANGKRIANCLNVVASGSPLTATCTWKPTVSGAITISATLTPNNGGFTQATAVKSLAVSKRGNTR